MNYVEQTGKTEEEAIILALEKLKTTREMVEVEVLEKGEGGIFGLGAKPVKVKVSLKEEPLHLAEKFLKKVIELGFDETIKVEKGDTTTFNLTGENLDELLGKNIKVLDALQVIVNKITNRHYPEFEKITIDASGKRDKHYNFLKTLAKRTALEVVKSGRTKILKNFPSAERRIIHLELENFKNVSSRSEGEENARKIVISPVKTNRNSFRKKTFSGNKNFNQKNKYNQSSFGGKY